GVAVRLPAPHPGGQGGLEGVPVQGAEDLREGALGGGLLAAEAQGVGQAGAVVAAELGDGLQGLVAGEDGDDGEGEDGGQGVDAAPGLAGVGDGGEQFDERWASQGNGLPGRRTHGGGHTQLTQPCQYQPTNSPAWPAKLERKEESFPGFGFKRSEGVE